jgi:hypothetical protein
MMTPTRSLIVALAAVAAVALLPCTALAATAAKTVVCSDGSTAEAGRGACSGHGGVDKAATAKAQRESADAKAEAKAKKAQEKAEAKAKKEQETADAKARKKAKAEEPGGAAAVTCKDGTTSKAGRGACRGHGGVAKGTSPAAAPAVAPAAVPAAPTPAAAAPVRAPAAAPTPAAAAPVRAPAAAPTPRRSEGAGGPANTDPTGAIARCKDGTYSHAQHHTGACSNHGGVAEWLDKK